MFEEANAFGIGEMCLLRHVPEVLPTRAIVTVVYSCDSKLSIHSYYSG